MFAYCGNNPVIHIDPTGELAQVLKAMADIIKRVCIAIQKPFLKDDPDVLVVAQTIYGEAGGRYMYPDDWQDGMSAVATVISNRVYTADFPDDPMSVCTEKSAFAGYQRGRDAYNSGTCDALMWDYALSLAIEIHIYGSVMYPGLTSEYVFFHSETYGSAERIERIKSKEETITIGGNMFYITYP